MLRSPPFRPTRSCAPASRRARRALSGWLGALGARLSRQTLVAGLTLCMAAAWPLVAQAQSAADADALIDRGVERRRAGDDAGALELFASAWEAGHTPRARAQMALAEQALGHFVDAEAHLLEALAATDDEWITLRREDLGRALEAIQLRLGYLEVRGGVEGADLRLDGRSVGTLPIDAPIRLAAGSYRLEVVMRGHYPFTRVVTIVPEGTTRETVVLAATPDAPASQAGAGDPVRDAQSPRDGAGEPRGRGRTAAGVSLLVGAGALLATSAVMFGVRQHRANRYNSDACLVGSATRGETCGALYDDTLRAQRASGVSLGVGVALAAAGTLMFVVGGDDDDDQASAVDAGSRAGAVQVACGASLGAQWGGQCRLRF